MGSYGPGAAVSESQQHQKDRDVSEALKGKRSIDQLHAAAIKERNGIAANRSERTGLNGQHNGDNCAKRGKIRVNASPVDMAANQALTHAVENLTANRSIIMNGRDSVIFDAMNAADNRISFEKMNAAVERMMAKGQLLVGRNGKSFVTFETLEIENRIATAYDQARNAELPVATPEACDAGIAKMEAQIASRLLARHVKRLAHKMTNQEKDAWSDCCRLTNDQAAMVGGIMQSKDGISVVEGDARTGKSTAMEAVMLIAESEGRAVYGLGPSAMAVEALSEAGIKSFTATAAMKNPQFWEKLNEKSVVVVDEAGFVGAKTLDNIITRTRAAGARLVLVGDTKQLGSVEAGAALNQLRDKAKANGALHCLNEIRRGESDFILDVHFASRDNSTSVIDMLYDKGHINVMCDRDARLKGIGQAYARRTEKERENTTILTDGNIDRIAINAAVRAELALNDEVMVQIFEHKDLTKAALLSIKNYEVDDVIRFNSGSDRYQKNAMLRVVEKHPAHLVIEDEKGVGAKFEPNMEGRNLTVGIVGEIPLAVGERIRFTANEKDRRYMNGDAAIVLSIKEGVAQVRMDKNRQVIELKLHGDRPVDFNYDYCQIGHSTKGGKGEMVIKYETASGLTNKNSWYTTNCRFTAEIRVFTDILGGKEFENLRKKIDRSAALDTARSALAELKLTDAPLKERATQQRPYFAPAVGYEKLDVPYALKRDDQFVKEALIKAIEIYRDAPDNTGKQLFIAGTEEFKNFVLDIAMKEKIDVRFSNVDMEERREEIIAEREQREMKTVVHAKLNRPISEPEQVPGQQEHREKLQLPDKNEIKQAIPAMAHNDMQIEFAVHAQMRDEKDLIRKGQECSDKHEKLLDADETRRKKSPLELQREKQHNTDAKEASAPGTRVPGKDKGDDDGEGSNRSRSPGSAPSHGSNNEWEQDVDESDKSEDLGQEIDAPR
jgi:hypothetical protein